MRGKKGTYGASCYKHGHVLMFDGSKGGTYIDVAYDYTGVPIDVINMYDHAEGCSRQTNRAAFMRAVREYVRDLTKHDADAFAENSR